jgi:CBS domain-containing protein
MPTVETILDIKGPNVATVDVSANVAEAAMLMNNHRIGAVIVTDGDKPVGIFTERDVLNRIVAKDYQPRETKVGDVMTSPMICCTRSTKVEECKAIMINKKIRHLPIIEDDKLLGIISIGDIMARQVVDQEKSLEYLTAYLYGRT